VLKQLLIDVGNTRIKWAYDTGAELVAPGELVHRGNSAAVTQFVAQLVGEPTAIYALNVAGPDLERSLQEALAGRFEQALQMVRTSAACGSVSNAYTSIEQLGVDRWAALVGAWFNCGRAAVVADVGTALTIDLVAADGAHRGGIIVPGLDLMRAALDSDTSDIGELVSQSKGPVPGTDWYGRDTLSAVQRGAVFSARAVIEQAVVEFSAVEAEPRVFLTGGDAALLQPMLSMPVDHRPNLVLEGLRRLIIGTV
jgi:type III pantothenate kinase